MNKFENLLSEALGLNESKDAPQEFKHDGENKKTKAGAHRFDDGIKFVQMKHDDQFKNAYCDTNITYK